MPDGGHRCHQRAADFQIARRTRLPDGGTLQSQYAEWNLRNRKADQHGHKGRTIPIRFDHQNSASAADLADIHRHQAEHYDGTKNDRRGGERGRGRI